MGIGIGIVNLVLRNRLGSILAELSRSVDLILIPEISNHALI